MSLSLPPAQAAAIMLPILITTGAVGFGACRKRFDRRALRVMLLGHLAAPAGRSGAGLPAGDLFVAATGSTLIYDAFH